MTSDRDALLTALDVHLDDRVLPALDWSRQHRPGRKPRLTDAELLCLAVAQHLLGVASERRWDRDVSPRSGKGLGGLMGGVAAGKPVVGRCGHLTGLLSEDSSP